MSFSRESIIIRNFIPHYCKVSTYGIFSLFTVNMVKSTLFAAACGLLSLLLGSCGFGGEPAVLETDGSSLSQAPSYPVLEPSQVSAELGLGPNVPTMVTWRDSKVYLSNLLTEKHVEMSNAGQYASSICYGAAISESKRYLAVLYGRAVVKYDLKNGSYEEVSGGQLSQTSIDYLHRIGWCQGDSTIYVLKQASTSEGIYLEAVTAGKPLPYTSTATKKKYLSRYVDILPNGDVLSLKTSTSRGVSIATAITRMLGYSTTFETVEYPLSSPIALSSGSENSSTRALCDVRADNSGRRLLLCFRHGVTGRDTLEAQIASLDGLVPNKTVNNTTWPLLHLTQSGRRIAALLPLDNVLYFTSPVSYMNQRSFTPKSSTSTILHQLYNGRGMTHITPSNLLLDVSSFSESKSFGFNVR